MRPAFPTRTAALASLLVLGAAPLAAEWTAAEILATSKEAHGGAAWDRVQTLVMAATFFLDGLDDPVPGEIWEDLPNGRYLRCHGAGESRFGWSFDGDRFWVQLGSGAPFPEAAPRREQVARACAYMHARGFWFPDRFPASASYRGMDDEGGSACHVLRLEPKGALPLECRVDAATMHLRRVSWSMERGTWSHAFLDYRSTQGLVLPYLVRCGWQGEPRQTRILVQDYRFLDSPTASAFRCPGLCLEGGVPRP